MNYLLSAQTLLDLCAEEPNAVQQWSREVQTESLRISVISWAQAASEIASLTDAEVRRTVESVFAALIDQICADVSPTQDGLLGFARNHAEQWRGLMFDRRLDSISQPNRQVYATAIAEGFSVVEERHALTETLRQLGLRIVVPGE